MKGGSHKPIEPKKTTTSKEKLTSDDQRLKEFLQDKPTLDYVTGLHFLIQSEHGEVHDINLKKLECDCRAKLNRPNVNCKHLVGAIILLGIRTSGLKRLIYAQEKKDLLALERQLQNEDHSNRSQWADWINTNKDTFLQQFEPKDDAAPLNCRLSDPRTLLVKEHSSFNEAKNYINSEEVFWRVIKAPRKGYKCPNHAKEDEEQSISKGQIVFEANCNKLTKKNGTEGPWIHQKHKRLLHANCITTVNANSKPLAFLNIKLPITSSVFVNELNEDQIAMLKESHGDLNFTSEEQNCQNNYSIIEISQISEKSGGNEVDNNTISSSLMDNLETDDFTEVIYHQDDTSSSILRNDGNSKDDAVEQTRTSSTNDPEYIPGSEPTSESLNLD